MTFVENITQGLTSANINDQTIASDLLAAGKLGAIGLTVATLEAITPELRQFFLNSLNECLNEHGRLSQLAEQRGWYKAHSTPIEQLQADLQMASQMH